MITVFTVLPAMFLVVFISTLFTARFLRIIKVFMVIRRILFSVLRNLVVFLMVSLRLLEIVIPLIRVVERPMFSVKLVKLIMISLRLVELLIPLIRVVELLISSVRVIERPMFSLKLVKLLMVTLKILLI